MIQNAPNRIIVFFLLLSTLCMASPGSDEWRANIRLVFASKTLVCTFGLHPDASAGYDNGLDILAPPATPEGLYAYWHKAVPESYHLQTDIKGPLPDPKTGRIHFTLEIINPSTTRLEWDPNQIPLDHKIVLSEGAGPGISMKENSMVSVSGNTSLDIAITPPKSFRFPMPAPGWALISLPMVPANRQVRTLFPNALENSAYEWDNGTHSYQRVEELVPGKGYWLAIAQAETLTVKGLPLDSVHLSLTAGWNMIGAPAERAFALTRPEGSIIAQFIEFDILDNSYQISAVLEPTKAYWVWANQECEIISYSGTEIKKGNRILPASFTLPPPPPFSMFSGGIIESADKNVLDLSSYPNPFREQTTLSFYLEHPMRIRIIIYNSRGEQILLLCHKEFTSGRHEIVWKGKTDRGEKVANGVYFIKLVTEDKEQSIKIAHLH